MSNGIAGNKREIEMDGLLGWCTVQSVLDGSGNLSLFFCPRVGGRAGNNGNENVKVNVNVNVNVNCLGKDKPGPSNSCQVKTYLFFSPVRPDQTRTD